MNSATDAKVYRYVSVHPNTRRGTIVDSLAYGDWEAGRQIREALDSLVARGFLNQEPPQGKRNLRYTIPTQVPHGEQK
jgi:hypothetical protein